MANKVGCYLFNKVITMAIRLLFAVLLAIILFNNCRQSDPLVTKYNLVWEDNFNGTSLDLSKWEHMIGDGSRYGLYRWGNNEEQYYRENNVSVSSGTLKIGAIAESFGGLDFTSGRIRSLNKGDFKYGKIEASMRMSNSGGLWHAFWMLPTNPSEGWPISGEIDIMEFVGNRSSEIFNTIHFADNLGNRRQLGDLEPIVYDNLFHKYTIEWDANKITWFLDDVQSFQVLRTNSQVSATWPFDAEFHLLLNVAVGGNLGGNVDNAALRTAKFMEVDYVKVYQNK